MLKIFHLLKPIRVYSYFSIYILKEVILFQSLGMNEKHIEFLHLCISKRTGIEPQNPFNLKYKASCHGFEALSFINCCKEIPRLIIIICTKAGYLFGGFSYISLDESKIINGDLRSFLFTLVNPHRIQPTMLIPKRNIKAGLSYSFDHGVTFGSLNPLNRCSDIGIRDNCNATGGWSDHGEAKSGYNDSTGFGRALFTGAKYFGPILEVLAFQA